jgi:hypothetical protein
MKTCVCTCVYEIITQVFIYDGTEIFYLTAYNCHYANIRALKSNVCCLFKYMYDKYINRGKKDTFK